MEPRPARMSGQQPGAATVSTGDLEARLFSTKSIFDNYVGVARGLRYIDKHVAISLDSYGGKVVSFSVVNDESTIESVRADLERNDVPAYRADKDGALAERKVAELYEFDPREKLQSIARDIKGPATLEERGRDDRAYFIALMPELTADSGGSE
jgi:hypothetical protein